MARKPPPARCGRLTKLDDAAAEKLVAGVAGGLPMKHAAALAGVTDRTVQRWLARARKAVKAGKPTAADRPFVSLLSAVKKAEAEAVAGKVAVIRRAADGYDETTTKTTRFPDGTRKTERTTRRVFDWTAAAWWLERRHPGEFGRAQRADAQPDKPAPPLVVKGEADPGAL